MRSYKPIPNINISIFNKKWTNLAKNPRTKEKSYQNYWSSYFCLTLYLEAESESLQFTSLTLVRQRDVNKYCAPTAVWRWIKLSLLVYFNDSLALFSAFLPFMLLCSMEGSRVGRNLSKLASQALSLLKRVRSWGWARQMAGPVESEKDFYAVHMEGLHAITV